MPSTFRSLLDRRCLKYTTSLRLLLAGVAVLVFVGSGSRVYAGDEQRVVYETEVDAARKDVWLAFTTKDGLESWMAPLADIELAVGGKMRANYRPEGTIGDESTIENTILAYDPERMLSLKATGFPKGFPFADAARSTWSVFYFEELPNSRTKITVVGLGYTDSEQSRKMRDAFAAANRYSLNQLRNALKKPHTQKTE